MTVIWAIAAGLAAAVVWVRAGHASPAWAFVVQVAVLAAFIATSATTGGDVSRVAAGALVGVSAAVVGELVWAQRHPG